jgi:sulfur carrier protein
MPASTKSGYTGGCLVPMIEIVVNGENQTANDLTSVGAFVKQLGLRAERVAVELNLEILPRARWEETMLRDGDRLEIVHFVGGG